MTACIQLIVLSIQREGGSFQREGESLGVAKESDQPDELPVSYVGLFLKAEDDSADSCPQRHNICSRSFISSRPSN